MYMGVQTWLHFEQRSFDVLGPDNHCCRACHHVTCHGLGGHDRVDSGYGYDFDRSFWAA